MHAPTVALLIGFIGFVVFRLSRGQTIRRNGQPLRRPPNTLPIAGNGLLFLQARHKLFSWFIKCEQLFGFETFQISVPTLPPGAVINDPANLEYVFKNEGVFTKGDFFKTRSMDLFGNGIINADGDIWKLQRKAGLHFLNVGNLQVLTDVALPKYLNETIRSLESVKSGCSIDLEEVFLELTTQLMGRTAYDMEMHNSEPFAQAFDFASGETGKRFQNPLWQLTEIPFGSKFRESVSRVQTFGSRIVSNAIETRRKAKSESGRQSALDSCSGSLINSLLDAIGDKDMVAHAALNYLSAGRDTTAQSLTWAFYLLMRNPGKAEVARNEVMKVVKLAASASAAPEELPLRDLDTASLRPFVLPYVTAVFYESLRFYPPIPFELRQCQESTTLPDGTFLPRDAILLWCTYAMNRSTSIWGYDADEFKPERWLVNGNLISRSASEYPVFNGGPRTCLGKKMAESMAVQTIAALLLKFDFEPIDNQERISKNSLTLPMEGGLPCRVKMRSQ